jgi:hypothetical protein
MQTITVEVSDTVYRLLEVLTHADGTDAPRITVQDVVARLIDHVQQGIYRPGAWERDWLCQAFGHEWLEQLVPGDPYGRAGCEALFQRPR